VIIQQLSFLCLTTALSIGMRSLNSTAACCHCGQFRTTYSPYRFGPDFCANAPVQIYHLSEELNTIISIFYKVTVAQWLRLCATSRKVAGSISDGITGIFNRNNPSGCTLALGLTQPLTEMSTRNISLGVGSKGGRCVGLPTLPPPCTDSIQILGVSNSMIAKDQSRPI
jgi:hypothetical protein